MQSTAQKRSRFISIIIDVLCWCAYPLYALNCLVAERKGQSAGWIPLRTCENCHESTWTFGPCCSFCGYRVPAVGEITVNIPPPMLAIERVKTLPIASPPAPRVEDIKSFTGVHAVARAQHRHAIQVYHHSPLNVSGKLQAYQEPQTPQPESIKIVQVEEDDDVTEPRRKAI